VSILGLFWISLMGELLSGVHLNPELPKLDVQDCMVFINHGCGKAVSFIECNRFDFFQNVNAAVTVLKTGER